MNAKELYLTIGQIDDELILSANELPHSTQNRTIKKLLLTAACLCLICLGIFQYQGRTSIYWNEIPQMPASKVSIPADSNIQLMTLDDIEQYYQIDALPDTLNDTLQRTSASSFMLYQDASGDTIYDQNQIWYQNMENGQTVSITLSRINTPEITAQDVKLSHINGTSILLSTDKTIPDMTIYTAQWELHGTTIRVTGSGLDEADFIHILKELLH